jgi:hypothetical protein
VAQSYTGPYAIVAQASGEPIWVNVTSCGDDLTPATPVADPGISETLAVLSSRVDFDAGTIDRHQSVQQPGVAVPVKQKVRRHRTGHVTVTWSREVTGTTSTQSWQLAPECALAASAAAQGEALSGFGVRG